MNPEHETTRPRLISRRIILNFEHFYTARRRVYCHIAFWLAVMGFYMLNHILMADLPGIITVAVIIRQFIPSILFYYFTAYFIVPRLFFRQRIYLAFICFFIPFLVAPTIDFLVFHALYKPFIEGRVSEQSIGSGLFTREFRNVIKPENIIYGIVPIFLRALPAFMMKLLVSTIHIFSSDDKRKMQQHRLEMQNMHLELNFLKSQMNPHYLFNTLNNLYSLIYLKDERALDVVSDLSEVMQYTLYESRKVVVPLEQELDFLERYLEMERIRNEDKNVRIEFHREGGFASDAVIAPLILFPFVENAVKYGINSSTGKRWMEVTAGVSGEELIFAVRNTKPAANLTVHKTRERYSGGIGIASTRRRLEMLYPGYSLTTDDSTDAYTILLKIKCLKNEPETALPDR